MPCPLCDAPGGTLVYQADKFRVIRADEPGFPAFYRVIWQAHVAEFSELERTERHLCMDAVTAVEQTLRAHLQPTKINLAALGNAVAHLHWHVIARFAWDSHFPASVWGAAQRPLDQTALGVVSARLLAVDSTLRASLALVRTPL